MKHPTSPLNQEFGLVIEEVTPADDDVSAVYQYLIGDEKDKV